jgi:hypothetical protein
MAANQAAGPSKSVNSASTSCNNNIRDIKSECDSLSDEASVPLLPMPAAQDFDQINQLLQAANPTFVAEPTHWDIVKLASIYGGGHEVKAEATITACHVNIPRLSIRVICYQRILCLTIDPPYQ